MALLTDALQGLASLPQPAVVAATGLLVLAECTLGLGFIAPGETGLLIAATTAVSVPRFLVLWLVVSVCAIAGDCVGYTIGRKYGDRLRETRLIRKIGVQHWDRAGELLRRRGPIAVFFARFLPVVRTLTPATAGASGLEFHRFLPAAAAGAVAWSGLHIGIGAAAGASAKYIEATLGRVSWVLFGALAVTGIVLWVRKRRRAAAVEEARPLERV